MWVIQEGYILNQGVLIHHTMPPLLDSDTNLLRVISINDKLPQCGGLVLVLWCDTVIVAKIFVCFKPSVNIMTTSR